MESALDIVLSRELACRATCGARPMSGRTTARIAAAIRSPVAAEPALGFPGRFDALMLRVGHSPRQTYAALTRGRASLNLVAMTDPAVLARHLSCDHVDGCTGLPRLVSALALGGHLENVRPAWLAAVVPDKFWLARALELGGHLDALDADWLIRNLGAGEALAYAAAAGGGLADHEFEQVVEALSEEGHIGTLKALQDLRA